MYRCEDFPCCGHGNEPEGCPDPVAEEQGYFSYRCIECGRRIKHGDEYPNAPSFHFECATRMADREYGGGYYGEDDED